MNYKVGYVYLRQQFAHPEKYFRAIRQVVARGDFTMGSKLAEFEKHFAQTIGVTAAIGVASGTDALMLILKALGIGQGDEVITAPNSFVATAAAVVLVGARPVFADVRGDYTIDPSRIEQAVTPRTKAIIPVHLTGMPADMYPILAIAKKHRLFVIEDAAQAVGALYDGKHIGSFGSANAFSMHPLKILNIWGDGGMITTDNEKLADRLRQWRNHGLRDRDDADFFGYNSRLDTIQAAIADTVLPDVERIVARRLRNASGYEKQLKSLEPMIRLPNTHLSHVPVRPTYTSYVVMVTARQKLIEFLTRKRIEVVVQYPTPIHLKTAARSLGYKKGDFPVCEAQARTILTLPNHQYLHDEDIDYVCRQIHTFYRNSRYR